MALSRKDFDYVRALLQKSSAIVLDDEKLYLADARLQILARREGFASVNLLLSDLRAGKGNNLPGKVVEALTTNETSFFRDVRPFEALRDHVLPELLRRRAPARGLRVWCAACSSGQEPYSVAMLLRDRFPELASWNVSLLATDLSTEMLDRARQARYSQLEVNRGLPAQLLVKYFRRDGADWCLKDEIRNLVEFRPLNLVAPWPALGPMDVVLLRNVLIYFDVPTKKAILARIRQLLRPDGYLFLGAAETTLHLDAHFERHAHLGRAGCYRLRGPPARFP